MAKNIMMAGPRWSPVRHLLGLRKGQDQMTIPINAAVGAGAGFVTDLAVRELMPKISLPTFAAPLITASVAALTAALLKDWKFGGGAFAGIALGYALDAFGVLRIPPS